MDCLDESRGDCEGDVFRRVSLSGSGMLWPRCHKHYMEYLERMQPVIDDINRRYPVNPPADFDPLYAGERWDEDDW